MIAGSLMKYHFAPLLSAAIVLASVSPVLADGGKSYTLKLHHDAVKGEKSKDHYKIQQSTTQKVLVGGKVAKEETEEIETETSGTRETLAVSPHNKPTEIKFTVDKFLLKTNDESGSKLKAGAVIIAKLGDAKKPTFTVDGEEPEADVAKALALIFELSPDREKEVDDDVVFDTKKPHEVGSTWNANIAEMIASMPEDMPFTLNKDSAKGTVKFPEVTTEGGVECAKVEIEAIMKPKGMKGMPPELKQIGRAHV